MPLFILRFLLNIVLNALKILKSCPDFLKTMNSQIDLSITHPQRIDVIVDRQADFVAFSANMTLVRCFNHNKA